MIDPLIIFLGLVTGLVVGLTSVGTGVVGTPALIILAGISPPVAAAAEIVQGAIMKIVGALKHLQYKNVNFCLGYPFIIVGIFASFLGATFTKSISTVLLREIIGVLLIVVSVLLILESYMEHSKHRKISYNVKEMFSKKKKVLAVIVGAIIGFIVGLTSIGSGVLMVSAMLIIFRIFPPCAVGTNIFIGAAILGVAGVTHTLLGNVDFALVLNLLIGSIPGILIGSHFCTKVPVKILRIGIAIIILISGVYLCIK